MKKRAIIGISLLLTTLSSDAEVSNIVVPNLPTVQFHRMDNFFERTQRDSVNKAFTISADGTGFIKVSVNVINPFACGNDPQGKTDTSCLENRDDPNQKIYFQLYYKPCGFNPEQALTQTGSSSHSITLDQSKFNPSACNQVPGTTSGFLNFVRIKFLESQPKPLSGLYLTTINLTVSAV